MKCPNCQDETSVVRTIKYETVVIRCRYCQRCKGSFSTHEEAVVFKADGSDVPDKPKTVSQKKHQALNNHI
jgi:transcriptional regulator NrdR family protein